MSPFSAAASLHCSHYAARCNCCMRGALSARGACSTAAVAAAAFAAAADRAVGGAAAAAATTAPCARAAAARTYRWLSFRCSLAFIYYFPC